MKKKISIRDWGDRPKPPEGRPGRPGAPRSGQRTSNPLRSAARGSRPAAPARGQHAGKAGPPFASPAGGSQPAAGAHHAAARAIPARPLHRPGTGRHPSAKAGARPGAHRPPARWSGSQSGSRGAATTPQGVLELERGGFGYLRSPANDYAPSDQDPVVPIDLIEDWNLEEGCFVEGRLGPPMKPGLGPTLTAVTEIDGGPPQRRREAPVFDSLTAVSPTERFVLPSLGGDLCVRAIELVAPIGRGQRAVIVAPPKSGKTVLLRLLAQGLVRTSPSVKLLVLLVDERPEEVTDFRRVLPGIEVVASSMDRMAQGHIRAAELLMARARRLVEAGKDVVVLLDSLTRLARAYNNALPGGGRTLSGGLDARAMAKPREFFGAARKIEGGGSLTIIATCLVDTGSQMDEVIFREFKGTGNMELVLDRSLAEKRIFPAFDVRASGTRKDESLFTPKELDAVHRIRQAMLRHSPADAMLALLGTLRQTRDNADLLARLTAQNGSASS